MALNIDGDALVYIAGFQADSGNGPFSHSARNINAIIKKVMRETEHEEAKIFLTSKDPKVNFRTDILETYKQNRAKVCKKCGSKKISKENSIVERFAAKTGIMKRRLWKCLGEVEITEDTYGTPGLHHRHKEDCDGWVADTKPVYYNRIRQFLIDNYDTIVCKWGEADDWLGVGLESDDWIATHDKDLRMIPCRYYNLKSGEKYEHSDPGKIYLTEKRKLDGFGFKWFCVQMITGDAVDNILKIHKGDGPVWIYKIWNPLTTMQEAWNMVKLYYTNTGNGDKLWRNGQLLWIAREAEQKFNQNVLDELFRGA